MLLRDFLMNIRIIRSINYLWVFMIIFCCFDVPFEVFHEHMYQQVPT